MALAAVAAAIAGLLLVGRGLRGRLVDSDPYCRRCGFNLRGHAALLGTCSECGAPLKRRRAVRQGRRRRRPVMVVAGLLFLALLPLLAAPGLSARARATWDRMAPTWWLADVALPLADEAREDVILTELCGRLARGELSDQRIAELARESIALYGEARRAADASGSAGAKIVWNTRRGCIVEEAVVSRLISDAELLAFLRHVLSVAGGGEALVEPQRVRPLVTAAHERLVRMAVGTPTLRGSPAPSWRLEVRVGPVRLGERLFPPSLSGTSYGPLDLRQAGQLAAKPALDARDLPPGEYQCRAEVTVSIDTAGSWTEEITFPVTVREPLPPEQLDEVLSAVRGALENPRVLVMHEPATAQWQARFVTDMRTSAFRTFDIKPSLLQGAAWQISRDMRIAPAASGARDVLRLRALWVLPGPTEQETLSIRLRFGTIVIAPPGIAGWVGPLGLEREITLELPVSRDAGEQAADFELGPMIPRQRQAGARPAPARPRP